MLRKLLLSAVLAITAVTGLSVTSSDASAQPPYQGRNWFDRNDWRGFRDHRDHRDHHVRYEVLYRHRNHWDSYGTYRDRDDAERAARRLRFQGFDVRIEREGFGPRW